MIVWVCLLYIHRASFRVSERKLALQLYKLDFIKTQRNNFRGRGYTPGNAIRKQRNYDVRAVFWFSKVINPIIKDSDN